MTFSDGRAHRLILGLSPDGDGFIALADRAAKARATIGTQPDGTVVYTLNDTNGATAGTFGLKQGGEPFFELKDKAGYRVVVGSNEIVSPRTGETNKTSSASILMFTPKNDVIWKAP